VIQNITSLEWAPIVGPKAFATHRIRPVAVAVVAIGGALLLYGGEPNAAFAVLAVLAGAAGWLLAARLAFVVVLAEVTAVEGLLWAGVLPLPGALFQVCALMCLVGLAHLAAEREPVVRRSADQERRLEGLTVLLEAAQSLAAAPDREAILNTAVHAAARGISRAAEGRPAHAAFHSLVGEQANISVVADGSLEREMAVGFEYPISRNQAARGAIRTGRPAFARLDHMTGPLRELAERLGWHVLIMAPVYAGGALQGLLAATARDGPAVERMQQYMLRTLAHLTSLRLDSAALLDEQRSAANAPDEVSMPVLLTGLDSATGVLSRELGLAALERDVLRARRSQDRSHCVAVVSVSTSEAANAAELIRLVADRLGSGMRREDLIFRYAENEFVCSFADMDSADAWSILNRIQSKLAAELGYSPFTIGLAPVGLESTAG
jgi:GGDEF domain-containing protein